METKEHLKYSKTVSDSLKDIEGVNTADDDHVEGNFVKWHYLHNNIQSLFIRNKIADIKFKFFYSLKIVIKQLCRKRTLFRKGNKIVN